MHDLLFVGAGLTAATMCAVLKNNYKILVVDCRPYIGGNCADSKIGDNYIQFHGPHNWHCADQRIMDFLSKYTEWIDFKYTVMAEIEGGQRVPFPYSQETEQILGKLSKDRILDLFFKDYSEKMWGMPFEKIPESIKARVPKDSHEKSVYFPGHFQAHPKLGYTRMIENMFDGVEIMLNVEPAFWKSIPARRIFYSGRPDWIDPQCKNGTLNFRTIDIEWKNEEWDATTTSVNFCSKNVKYTRKSNYGTYYKKPSNVISYETPRQANLTELTPYYPIPTKDNLNTYQRIKKEIAVMYPNLELIGRLGRMMYINMDQAVGAGLTHAQKFTNLSNKQI